MRISVVICTYNNKSYLGEAIDSILAQDTDSFECIVVDDGSTDGTSELLAAYNNFRLKVISLPINCGTGTARNVGIRSASGDYLAIMDADDIAFPNRLSSQAAFLEQNPDVHILGSRTIRIAESTSSIIDRPRHPLEDSIIKSKLLLLNGSAIIHPTTMIRGDIIRTNNLAYPSLYFGEDLSFWVKCIAAGVKFHTLENELLYKRRHHSNLSLANSKTKELVKFPLRVELIGMYFPELTGHEARSLAMLMQGETPLSIVQARTGIAAGVKAMSEKKSYYGESRDYLNSILRTYLTRAQRQFR